MFWQTKQALASEKTKAAKNRGCFPLFLIDEILNLFMPKNTFGPGKFAQSKSLIWPWAVQAPQLTFVLWFFQRLYQLTFVIGRSW